MLAGPFLAFLASLILLSFTLMTYPGNVSGLVLLMFVAWYTFGMVPAVTAAALVAYWIDTKGWIGLGRWSLVTLLLGMATASVFYILVGADLLHPTSYGEFTAAFLVVTAFASLILRILIIGLGWMRRRPPPIWEVF